MTAFCLIAVLDRLISVRVGAACAACGLTATQGEVLLLLLESRGSTCAELSRVLHHDGGAMSRLVAALETRGLVRRERIASVRRSFCIELTDPGRKLAERCRQGVVDCWHRLLGSWDESEVGQLIHALERLARTMGAERSSRGSAGRRADVAISSALGARRPR